MKIISDYEAAVIGGFMIGEGCFSIGSRDLAPLVSATQLEKGPLDFILNITEVGSIYRRQNGRGRKIHALRVSSRKDIIPFVERILPYLSPSPRQFNRAQLILEMAYLLGPGRRRRGLPKDIRIQRENVFQRWKETRR